MHIGYLANHTQHIPTLARWFHDQWGYLSPNYTLKQRTQRLRAKARRKGIPITFIAVEGKKPIGSASLVANDMDTRPDWKPWLASVYVAPSHRSKGVGEALVQRVVDEARRQAFESLYLWTPNKEAFYGKRGWKIVETTEYRNERAVVMKHSTGAQQ